MPKYNFDQAPITPENNPLSRANVELRNQTENVSQLSEATTLRPEGAKKPEKRELIGNFKVTKQLI
jgi:hypothetical protein